MGSHTFFHIPPKLCALGHLALSSALLSLAPAVEAEIGGSLIAPGPEEAAWLEGYSPQAQVTAVSWELWVYP